MNKIGITWIALAVFIAGLIIGGLGGALVVTLNNARYQADAIVFSLTDTTASMVPLLAAISDGSESEQIALLESNARSQLIAGIVSLDASMPLVSEEGRRSISGVLTSIALNREKLKIGKYSDPPLDHIEGILVRYAE